ncbi:MAG: glycosyltransferase [Acidobacteriia bacterium]|nr:glycosyltransferase [Terriglobia bacterium]
MRICLIARRFYESNTHMQQFAKALVGRGDTVDVICARRNGHPKREIVDGVNVYRLQARNIDEPNKLVYLAKVLLYMLRVGAFVGWRHLRSRYDLVHVQSLPDFLVFSAAVPRLLGTPVILDLRDLVPELFVSKFASAETSSLFRLAKFIEKCSARFSEHVIVANPLWYDRVARRSARPSKCSMIWYSPDPVVFHPRPKRRNDGKFVIMYPGTLSWHQGVDIAVRAMPKIRAAIPEAELHIYGEGIARELLIDLANRAGVGDAVRFFDFVPTPVLAERMADCDLAVVPKRASERFGNEAASTKIPEFMAMGIPVVASRTEIEGRFFDDSQLCYFRSEDEHDLVRAVVSVYRDPVLRNRLCENGSRSVREQWQAIRKQYLELADSLVNGKRPWRNVTELLPETPVRRLPATPGARRPAARSGTRLLDTVYYACKPYLPWDLRIAMRRLHASFKRKTYSAVWPIDPNSDTPPVLWPGWPEGKRFALVLTHDVDTAKGLERVERVAKLDAQHGFRSSFNFVPEGEYRLSPAIRRDLVNAGFEIGVHGLEHDGKLYASRAIYARKAAGINKYLQEWNACGFRSPLMQHRLSWLHNLSILYDSSTFDTDPFEPEPDGVGAIFPFWVAGPGDSGYVELPYTLPQDFTLFVILRERNIEIWKRKLDWLAERGGMVLLNTHPDYMSFQGAPARDEYPASYYEEFLAYVRQKYEGLFWTARPCDVARFCTSGPLTTAVRNGEDAA